MKGAEREAGKGWRDDEAVRGIKRETGPFRRGLQSSAAGELVCPGMKLVPGFSCGVNYATRALMREERDEAEGREGKGGER